METYKRGDIFYVEIQNAIGHEMMKDRPAVIVSCDALNFTGAVVSVVYLTGQQKTDAPYHVLVKSTASVRHGSSTALCENIYTVDKSRVGKRMGSCTPEELEAIDNGILMSLALGDGKYKGPQKKAPVRDFASPVVIAEDTAAPTITADAITLAKTMAERDTYKALYEQLLGSLTMERRATA